MQGDMGSSSEGLRKNHRPFGSRKEREKRSLVASLPLF